MKERILLSQSNSTYIFKYNHNKDKNVKKNYLYRKQLSPQEPPTHNFFNFSFFFS